MRAPKRVALCALVLGASAGCREYQAEVDKVCADDGTTPCSTDGDCPNGVACVDVEDADSIRVLKPLGVLSLSAFPGDEVPLKVVALRSKGAGITSEEDLQPLSGEVVSWSVSSAASDASVSNDSSLTDEQGITTISVDTGTVQDVPFQVVATLAGASPVTFSFQVRVDARELRVLTPLTVDSVVDRTERLRVQLIRPSADGIGIPVSGESLQVELLGGTRDGARLETSPGDLVTILTDLSGIGTVRFHTGSVARDYTIEFCGGLSCQGVQSKTVQVSVDLRGGAGGCQSFVDCDPGYICAAGVCELGASYCSDDGDCPTGYTCGAARQCELGSGGTTCESDGECDVAETCGGLAGDGDRHCIDPEGCQGPGDCPVGWTCHFETGACEPPPVTPGSPVIDVSGDWDTTYAFDLSDALPSFFTDGLLPVVQFLDLVFRSQIEIDVPVVGDLLEVLLDELVAEYVPDWVVTVVIVLGDFISVFQQMLVEAEMTLYQPGSPRGVNVSGEEAWDSATFFIPSLCPGGLHDFQQDPSCGAVDVIVRPSIDLEYSNNDPDVGVDIRPFNGQVQPPQAPADPLVDPWMLFLHGRNVRIGLSQLINVLLDVVVSAASNGQWYDFEEFLVDIIPCLDLQYAIDDLACDITDGDICSIPGIEAICDAAAATAVQALTELLGSVELEVLELEFDQNATAHHEGEPSMEARQLGNPADPEQESWLVGDTEIFWILDGNFDENSWWYGLR